jgi:serine/threonine protein kinase
MGDGSVRSTDSLEWDESLCRDCLGMSLELDRDPGWWRSRALGMLEEALARLRVDYVGDAGAPGGVERAQRFDAVKRFLSGSATDEADHSDTAHALGLSREDVHQLVCQLRKRLGTLLHHDIRGTADDDDVAIVKRSLRRSLELPPDPTLVSSAVLRCKKGHALHADAPQGLCPTCLFDLEALARLPERIGPYQVLEPLGEGGFGLVYRARGKDGKEVAVKVLRNLQFSDPEVVAQFRKEPTVSAELSPRYVVQVLETGEHDGVPYFVMEYMPGGTLREHLHEYRAAPRRAAELMIRIAEAVEYLHGDPARPERARILHRDLKPENILFDARGQPRISDFGIAKLAKGNTWTVGSRIVGCPAYMAPEVYRSPAREVTAAEDVYALGVMLYELLTGARPFDGTDAEIMQQRGAREAILPRQRVPQLDRFLEVVVLVALEKDPAQRYQSAADFAGDLERALLRKSSKAAPPVALSTRVRTAIRRRPLTTAACAWVLSLVLVVGLGIRSTLSDRREMLEREQHTNASVAGMQAVAVNLQLRAYEQRIAELSQDTEVFALLDSTPPEGLSSTLVQRLAPFDTLFVLKPDGRPGARTSPKDREYLARSFEFRDYFRGARRLGERLCRGSDGARAASLERRAHLGRAFTSEADGRFQFAVSAPLCRGNAWAGIVAGTIASDKVLGAVRVLDDRNARVAAVLGPRDRDRHEARLPLPSDLHVIVHPGLDHGHARRLHQPTPAVLRAGLGIASSDENSPGDPGKLRYAAPYRVDDYRDPVAGFEGAWSAVFAAADASGYIVAVQSRRDVTPLAELVARKLAIPAYLFGVTLLALIAVAITRHRRP